VMSPAGGNATPRKIHNDGAERKYKNEGDKWWSQTPSFSPYHILNIQCILVQQSSITLWHNNTFTMYFFTRTHYTNGLTPRRPSMPRTRPGGSSEVNHFKSSRHHLAQRENHDQPVPPEQSILVKHIFADLIN
jgi:hypothetical protein